MSVLSWWSLYRSPSFLGSPPPPGPHFFNFWLTSAQLEVFRNWVIGTERKKKKRKQDFILYTPHFVFPSFLCYWHAWSHHRIQALQSWQRAWCSTLWPRCVGISWQPVSCHHPLTLSAQGRKLPGSLGQKAIFLTGNMLTCSPGRSVRSYCV